MSPDRNPSRPGPIHDRAMHYIVEGDLVAWCDWLNVKLDQTPTRLSPVFVAEKRQADLLIKTGNNRLLHVEYIRNPEPDMFARMITYRGHIMQAYLDMTLTQYAILLGTGHLHTHDDPDNGFFLGLNTIRLPDVDPHEFLTRPGLAALAELAKGDQHTRARSAAAAIRMIRTLPAERHAGLFEAMLSLGTISLDRTSIDLIAKEMNMTLESIAEFYNDTKMGQMVREWGREEGREQGIEQGIERGRKQGREEALAAALAALLRQRFGSDQRLTPIAGRMAHDLTSEASIELIGAVDSLDDLVSRLDELHN